MAITRPRYPLVCTSVGANDGHRKAGYAEESTLACINKKEDKRERAHNLQLCRSKNGGKKSERENKSLRDRERVCVAVSKQTDKKERGRAGLQERGVALVTCREWRRNRLLKTREGARSQFSPKTRARFHS